ncbi:D-alanyl-D-alanine carboxypeptidase/D-alanyl-D-alanine-endopeptidase [Spongisporangium articulatum]|uniref:D-alanyl-D-alanine carboxypeptidase/D-alanyl-D-alanine-endopeptidase n=1 Tax=Spongisporangium articulatum TaxID=3362603 RepID=A0ABW8ANF0_9ACTN
MAIVTALATTVAVAGTAGFVLTRRVAPPPTVADSFDLAADVPGAVQPGPGDTVLPTPATDASVPTAAALDRALGPALRAAGLGKQVSLDVLDPASGEHLLSQAVNTAREPASTAKLLTGAAALSALGADTTLPTRTVQDDGGTVYLVGGGDVLLAKGSGDPEKVDGRAGLRDLAVATAAALTAQGRTTIALTLDDDLFGPQTRSPKWSPGDVGDGYVAPVQPLEVDAGRVEAEHYGRRAADPAATAAAAFAKELKRAGVTVTGKVKRGDAPKTSTVLAGVNSATVAEQVEYALTESDNTVAEALARLVARATGGSLTFAGSGKAVLAQVQELGLGINGATLTDGSGLGDGSRLPASLLSGVVALAAGGDHPELRPLLTGMPVAAVSGTLADRFLDRDERGAAGLARAKTGTLTGVTSLAGTVVDADGRLLVFTLMADKVTSTLGARAAMDAMVTTLAACGCR